MSYAPQHDKDLNDLKTLSIFWYVSAGLGAFALVFFLIYFVVALGMMGLFGIAGAAAAQEDDPNALAATALAAMFPALFALFSLVGMAITLLVMVLQVAVARNLTRFRGFNLCMAMAAIACLNIPIGTLLGVFTIMVLLRDSVKERFQGGPSGLEPSRRSRQRVSPKPMAMNNPSPQTPMGPAPSGSRRTNQPGSQAQSPNRGGGKMWLVLGAGGVVAALLLAVVCGGAVLMWSNTSADPGTIAAAPQDLEDPRNVEQVPTSLDAFRDPVTQVGGAPGFSTSSDALVGLNSADPRLQRSAAQWLATANVEPDQQNAVAASLEVAIRSSDPTLASAALDALLVWGTANNSAAVASALRNRRGNPEKAIRFLGRFPDPNAADAVAPYLAHDGSIADTAAETLQQMGSGAQPAVAQMLASKDADAVARATKILQGFGVQVDESLLSIKLEQLLDDNLFAARAAGQWLATQPVDENRQSEVARVLDEALLTSDTLLQAAVLKALAVWGDMQSGPGLISYMQSNPNQALVCIQILGNVQYAPAAPEIAKRLDGREGEAAATALIALGPGAAPAVLPYFNDRRSRARDRARRILAALETPGDTLLKQCLADITGGDGKDVSAIITWIGRQELSDEQRTEVGAVLAPLTRHPDRDTAGSCILALVKYGDARVLPPLGEALGTSRTQGWARGLMRNTGAAGEATVVQLLDSENADIVTGACYVLGDIGGADSVAPLEAVVKKSPPNSGPSIAANNALMVIKKRQTE